MMMKTQFFFYGEIKISIHSFSLDKYESIESIIVWPAARQPNKWMNENKIVTDKNSIYFSHQHNQLLSLMVLSLLSWENKTKPKADYCCFMLVNFCMGWKIYNRKNRENEWSRVLCIRLNATSFYLKSLGSWRELNEWERLNCSLNICGKSKKREHVLKR